MKQTALITGSGIGIGAATAAAFASAGYHVIATDVLERECESVCAQICASGASAQFLPLDVTDSNRVSEVFDQVMHEHGRIDAVIANAGIAHKVPIAEMSDEKWHRTLDVDLNGVMRVFRAAVPHMRKAGSGNLIALSSIMGIAYGWDEHVHYSTAKAGVIGLVRGLAVELARNGVRVNGIAPGYIRTAQALSSEHSLGPEGLEAAAQYIPMGRVGEAADIADVAVMLASDSARYLTGQVITVDGGLLVGRY